MYYWIWLKQHKKPLEENIIPGLIVPERIEPMLTAQFAEEQLNLCENCEMACRCHPIDRKGRKWCTVLLNDAIRPSWKVEDVI
jgi:hypothetical protein